MMLINPGSSHKSLPEHPVRVSMLQVFRLTYVLFSLAVYGEVLYRRDGLTYYYASFSEFIPTLALVTIFWSGGAVIATILLWGFCRSWERISLIVRWRIRTEHILLYMGMCALLGSISWIVKPYVVHHGTMLKEKIIVFVIILLIAASLAWLWRNKARRWFEIIERWTTHLFWIFGILFLLSVILVAHNAL